MPAYLASPFTTKSALLPGVLGYSWGSFDTHNPGTRMAVSTVAITSNVATLAVKILEGPIPVVTSGISTPLISVQGTTVQAGAFNVTNVALVSVTIDSTTGVGTLTFALTHADVATTANAGIALVPPVIVYETLPGTATAGQQFAVSRSTLATQAERGITWFTLFTGSPSTVTMNLQGADVDQDAAYTTVDTSTVTTGESRSVGDINYNFYRVKAASTGGTSPTFVSGIAVR